jgi:hypothetical protein
MALNFPSAPVVGQVYSAEGADFVWNGALWVVLAPENVTFATGPEVAAGVRNDVVLSPLTAPLAFDNLPGEPVAKCRAWARYNSQNGQVLGSFNIASLAIINDGWAEITFAEPLASAAYGVITTGRGVTNHSVTEQGFFRRSAGACRIGAGTTGGGNRPGFWAKLPLIHVSFWQ